MIEAQNTVVPDQNVEPAPIVVPADQQKVMHQHEINALVSGAKQKGFDKGYEQARAELSAQYAASQNNGATVSQNTGFAQTVGSEEDRLRHIANEVFEKQKAIENANNEARNREMQGQQILNELNLKVQSAKGKFEDYDKVVDPEYKAFVNVPEVVLFANMTDNPGEVLYDLAKNPTKIASIVQLSRLGMHNAAVSEVQKLSSSIKANELGVQQEKPKVPLSQITPSNVGVGKVDRDSYSSDFRGKY